MHTRVLILGGGIAGLTAALYLKRARIDFYIVEENLLGGQLNRVPFIENYPGFVGNGGDLIDQILQQLGPDIWERVFLHRGIKFTKINNQFVTTLDNNQIITSDFLINAVGCPPRKLPVPNGDDERIHYCVVCDGPFYQDKQVMIIGDGNSAFTYALELSRYCASVKILMLTNQIFAEQVLQDKVKSQPNITILPNKEVIQLEFLNNDTMRAYCVDGSHIAADGVFVAIGYEETEWPIFEHSYNIGDCNIKHPHKQAILAAAEGCETALKIIDIINREAHTS